MKVHLSPNYCSKKNKNSNEVVWGKRKIGVLRVQHLGKINIFRHQTVSLKQHGQKALLLLLNESPASWIQYIIHYLMTLRIIFILSKWSFLCFLIFLFMYLFLAAQAFSSCSEWELLFSCGAHTCHHSGFSCCGEQAQQVRCTGLVAPWHVESYQTRNRTCVPSICREILNHWTTREVPAS